MLLFRFMVLCPTKLAVSSEEKTRFLADLSQEYQGFQTSEAKTASKSSIKSLLIWGPKRLPAQCAEPFVP